MSADELLPWAVGALFAITLALVVVVFRALGIYDRNAGEVAIARKQRDRAVSEARTWRQQFQGLAEQHQADQPPARIRQARPDWRDRGSDQTVTMPQHRGGPVRVGEVT